MAMIKKDLMNTIISFQYTLNEKKKSLFQSNQEKQVYIAVVRLFIILRI